MAGKRHTKGSAQVASQPHNRISDRLIMAFLRRLEPYGPAPMLFLALMVCVGALGMLNGMSGLSDVATLGLGSIALIGYTIYLNSTRASQHAAMREARDRVTEARKEGQDMRAKRRAALPPPQNEQLRFELRSKPKSDGDGGDDDVRR